MFDQFPNRDQLSTWYEDFLSVNAGQFSLPVSGTGAAVTAGTGTQNRPGIATLDVGTTNSGAAGILSAAAALLLGGGLARFQADLNIPTLSTSGEAFTTRAGFLDASSGDPTDGVFFRVNDTNGGALVAVCRANGTETTVVTPFIPTAGTWFDVAILVTPDGSLARFFAGLVGTKLTEVAAISANIPTATGRETGIGLTVTKTAGTTSRTVSVNSIFAQKAFNTAQ